MVLSSVDRALDYWRVNSYGYPCFFSENEKSQEAWTTLLTFFDFQDYSLLKEYWSSSKAPRRLSSQAVESWKATFEEFGILFVESRSSEITITPAGIQLREAAQRHDREEFAWIGLNTLLRYPLRGPRRPKSHAHDQSDLLLYRFFYSALLDLDGYIWRTELERVLCRVFLTNDAINAVEDIRVLRRQPNLISQINMPVARREGGFYNSLNQVTVHAGMNHLLLGSEVVESPFGISEPRQRHFIRKDWMGMIRKALSNGVDLDYCATGGFAVGRVPAAPNLPTEANYFAYLGAPVALMSAQAPPSLVSQIMEGESVFFLQEHVDYRLLDEHHLEGLVASLCQLSRSQRVILSHDERWTYMIEDKTLINSSSVRIRIRRARPISNFGVIRAMRGEKNV